MIGQVVGGKYILEREIGRGGMGAIWIAYDRQLRRRVALKLMRPDPASPETSRARFEREALAIAQIKNPHVVQIYDYGIDNGSPFIVMELLEGEDLDTRHRRLGKLDLATVSGIVLQVAKGLGTAHAAGIVHRDLKPANIFLARVDAEEVVKILDFGVAAITSGIAGDAFTTRAGALVGTPQYMSPEQARGSRLLDHRSDLWSLAVVAYRCLTDQFPFSGALISDLIHRIANPDTPHTPATAIAPELPAAVDGFFARAFAKKPEDRFRTARELMTAFAALTEAKRQDQPRKILVIDDEEDVVLLIKQRFRKKIQRSIYEFSFAQGGEEALAILRRHPDIEIALTDINMPGMDGLTFLEHVGEASPLCKVVMLSAYSDMSNVRKAMTRGAFDFLVKPIDLNDLEHTIERTLARVAEIKATVRSTEENALLRMFVSSGILERLIPALKAKDLLISESAPGAVAFLRVHGLSEAALEMPPDAAIRALNANLDVIVPVILGRRGVIDRLLGDAAIAVFQGDDHVARAIDACLEVRDRIAELRDVASGPSPYAHGITAGIAAGKIVSGSVGSHMFSRMDYAVLGEPVTTAARLAAGGARGEILVSAEIHASLEGMFACERCAASPTPSAPEAGVYNVIDRATTGTPDLRAPTIETPTGESVRVKLPAADEPTFAKQPRSEGPPAARPPPSSDPPAATPPPTGGPPSSRPPRSGE